MVTALHSKFNGNILSPLIKSHQIVMYIFLGASRIILLETHSLHPCRMWVVTAYRRSCTEPVNGTFLGGMNKKEGRKSSGRGEGTSHKWVSVSSITHPHQKSKKVSAFFNLMFAAASWLAIFFYINHNSIQLSITFFFFFLLAAYLIWGYGVTFLWPLVISPASPPSFSFPTPLDIVLTNSPSMVRVNSPFES